MGSCKVPYSVLLLYFVIGTFFVSRCFAIGVDANITAQLLVNASDAAGQPIPDTLFGLFFEVSFLTYNADAYFDNQELLNAPVWSSQFWRWNLDQLD